jgi:hypothetical protein
MAERFVTMEQLRNWWNDGVDLPAEGHEWLISHREVLALKEAEGIPLSKAILQYESIAELLDDFTRFLWQQVDEETRKAWGKA